MAYSVSAVVEDGADSLVCLHRESHSGVLPPHQSWKVGGKEVCCKQSVWISANFILHVVLVYVITHILPLITLIPSGIVAP